MKDITKKILVGSQALKIHFPNDNIKTHDHDYLINGKTGRNKNIEFYDINENKGLKYIFDNNQEIAAPEQLYTLKLSHCFWNVHWQKTMFHILFCQQKGLKHDENLFQLLYNDWIPIHGKKRAYLNKSNEDFFKDNVKRTYQHDDIHQAVKYNDKPMFEYLKKDINKAMINEEMFKNLNQKQQFQLAREEIYVTALERFIIPKNFHIDRLTAYRAACRLLLTSMTKGWFPKFIALNWIHLNRPDNHDFIQLFKNKLGDKCEITRT